MPPLHRLRLLLIVAPLFLMAGCRSQDVNSTEQSSSRLPRGIPSRATWLPASTSPSGLPLNR